MKNIFFKASLLLKKTKFILEECIVLQFSVKILIKIQDTLSEYSKLLFSNLFIYLFIVTLYSA